MSAEVTVPAESPWFTGHFPGNPVLPGIAQLGIVFDMIQQYLNEPLRLLEVSRVKYKKMILPDDRFTISAVAKENARGTFAFRILDKDELITSGTMTVEKTGIRPDSE